MYVRKILVINIEDLLKYDYLKTTMQGFVPYLAFIYKFLLRYAKVFAPTIILTNVPE